MSMRSGPSLRLRSAILRRDHFLCQLCGASPLVNPRTELEVDHRVPRAKGGTNNVLNLWTLCRPCNRTKGISDLVEEEEELTP